MRDDCCSLASWAEAGCAPRLASWRHWVGVCAPPPPRFAPQIAAGGGPRGRGPSPSELTPRWHAHTCRGRSTEALAPAQNGRLARHEGPIDRRACDRKLPPPAGAGPRALCGGGQSSAWRAPIVVPTRLVPTCVTSGGARAAHDRQGSGTSAAHRAAQWGRIGWPVSGICAARERRASGARAVREGRT